MSYTGYRKSNPKTPPAALAKARARQLTHPRKRVWKREYEWAKYGLTRDTYYALWLGQSGKCAVCRRKPSGKGHCSRLHIDHDHATDKVRGLLCSKCNIAIGQADDSPDRLRALADYLVRSNEFVKDD